MRRLIYIYMRIMSTPSTGLSATVSSGGHEATLSAPRPSPASAASPPRWSSGGTYTASQRSRTCPKTKIMTPVFGLKSCDV